MSKEIEILNRALNRERLARKEAEKLLENKSLELYELNKELQNLNANLEQKVEERTNEIQKNQKQLRVLFDQSPFPKIIVSRGSAEVLVLNDTFENTFGYDRGVLLGSKINFLFDDDSVVNKLFTSNLNLSKIETSVKNSSGNIIEVELFISEIYFDEQDSLMFTLKDVTARKRYERKNKENELKFKTLVESVSDMIFRFDENGLIKYVNPPSELLLGLSKSELVGKSCFDFVAKSHRKSVAHFYENQLKNNIVSTYNEVLVSIDSSKDVWLGVSVDIGFSQSGEIEFIVLARNINERVLAQQALKKSEEKYRMIIENLELGLLEVDKDEKIVKAYPKFCAMFKYKSEDLIGKNPVKHLLVEGSVKIMEEQNIKRREGVSGVYEVKIKCADGEERWVLISGTPYYDSEGVYAGSLGIHLDITERKNMEDKMREAKEVAESSVKSKEMFMANMSHEIRTPMNAIIGMGELLLNSNLEGKEKEYVKAINYSADNLLKIIDDILDFSKIETGNLEVHPQFAKLIDVVEGVKSTMALKIDSKGLLFHLNHNLSREYHYIDSLRLNQVLINLVGNSLKFTSKGSIDLNVHISSVNRYKDKVRFEVVDTGIGIKKENFERIFNSFSQEDENTSRTFGGTGLGLSISKNLIEKMGGEINLESEYNKGSKFYFELEFERGEQKSYLENEQSYVVDSLSGMSVLLVDDNKVNIFMAQTVLENKGANVSTAEDGLQAIELIKNNHFDVVLMDVRMPVMGGLEATKIIRRQLKNNLPIIALTANALNGDDVKCIEAGMDDYLAKPFSQKDLMAKLSKYCDVKLVDNSGSASINSLKADSTQGLMDLSILSKNTGGDEAFMKDMIRLYLETSPRDLESLNLMVSNGDLQGIGGIAHKLKPSVQNLGVSKLHELCLDVEKKGKANEVGVIDSAKKLSNYLQSLANDLNNYLSQK